MDLPDKDNKQGFSKQKKKIRHHQNQNGFCFLNSVFRSIYERERYKAALKHVYCSSNAYSYCFRAMTIVKIIRLVKFDRIIVYLKIFSLLSLIKFDYSQIQKIVIVLFLVFKGLIATNFKFFDYFYLSNRNIYLANLQRFVKIVENIFL